MGQAGALLIPLGGQWLPMEPMVAMAALCQSARGEMGAPIGGSGRAGGQEVSMVFARPPTEWGPRGSACTRTYAAIGAGRQRPNPIPMPIPAPSPNLHPSALQARRRPPHREPGLALTVGLAAWPATAREHATRTKRTDGSPRGAASRGRG